MRISLTIACFFLIAINGSAQTSIYSTDSMVYEFIVKADRQNDGMHFASQNGSKFKVVKSNFKFPVHSLSIRSFYPKNIGWKGYERTYKVKGYVILATHRLYPTFYGLSRTEYEINLKPISILVNLTNH